MRITRDPLTGGILSIVRPDKSSSLQDEEEEDSNPLNDPLNALDGFDAVGGKGVGIVGLLEAEAKRMEVGRKRGRTQSKAEEEWVERLVERWGDDFRGMVLDRRLNPWQQSEGDLRRRVGKWRDGKRKEGIKEGGGGVGMK